MIYNNESNGNSVTITRYYKNIKLKIKNDRY